MDKDNAVTLLPTETPQEIVQFGQGAAKQLIDLVKKNGWSVHIQNKEFLQFEAWQTVGRFFGYTVKTLSTEYVDYDGVKGFAAKAVVIDSQGREIGAGEGLCLDDEPNWKNKPLFAIKSMAQTRACGRSLRQVLAWVVVLAGYSPATAEEMPKEDHQTDQPRNTGGYLEPATEKQIKAIYAIAKTNLGWNSEETTINCKKYLGIESWNDMNKGQASELIDKIQNGDELKNG